MAQSQTDRPNIVFILADDLGIGDTGITGQNARAALGLPSFATPNIDSIAQAGVRFDNMYAGAPSCSPSRASLLTGFHQGHTIFDRASVFGDIRGGDQDRTWGQMLQDAGYATGLFGKWHLGGIHGNATSVPEALPTRKGFETVYAANYTYRTTFQWVSDGSGGMVQAPTPPDPTWPGPGPPRVFGDTLVANQAAQFIRDNAAGAQPFAAYFAPAVPHTQYAEVPQDHPYVNMPWPKGSRDYAGMIYYLDSYVGQILNVIDDPNGDGDNRDSVADNTIVIFASDNGPALNDASTGYKIEFFNSNSSYQGAKFITLEGGVRTPFFVRWPSKIGPNSVNESFVGSFADIMPTFAELVGQANPLGIDGRSMLPELTGEGVSDRRKIMAWTQEREIGPDNPGAWSVRIGDWKFTKRRPTSLFLATTYRLYNIAQDPGELRNLAASRPDLVAAMEEIGHLEGFDREPIGPVPNNPGLLQTENTYFTQYKTWAPTGESADFFAAANWSGGTQFNEPGSPEAIDWNTGPADNWLATLRNNRPTPQQVILNANAQLLAIDVRGGVSQMTLQVAPGVELSGRNGIRISAGGTIELLDGGLNTIRDVEILPGGQLAGTGLISGQQHLVAGISEFAELGLFEPQLVNKGLLVVGDAAPSGGNAGMLLINGDFTQSASGLLRMDLFSLGGAAGFDYDFLDVGGQAVLGGVLEIFADPALTVALGDSFPLLTSAKGLTGAFSEIRAPPLGGGLGWAVEYSSQAALLKVVSQSSSGPLSEIERWKASMGINAGGDWDADGDTDGFDFLVWQRQSAPAGAVTPTPEPASALLACVAAILGANNTRLRAPRRRA
ncbi:MAG: sulfatase-like hydrolase/transferase [Pirellulales bacterium]|nr:sulfatase-like hydrolase/transferase [Pirellulales bacterium]